jgi:hypothetical protein
MRIVPMANWRAGATGSADGEGDVVRVDVGVSVVDPVGVGVRLDAGVPVVGPVGVGVRLDAGVPVVVSVRIGVRPAVGMAVGVSVDVGAKVEVVVAAAEVGGGSSPIGGEGEEATTNPVASVEAVGWGGSRGSLGATGLGGGETSSRTLATSSAM